MPHSPNEQGITKQPRISNELWDKKGEAVQLLGEVVNFIAELSRKKGTASQLRSEARSWKESTALSIYQFFNKTQTIQQNGMSREIQLYPSLGGVLAKYIRIKKGYFKAFEFSTERDWPLLKRLILGREGFELHDMDAIVALIPLAKRNEKTFIKMHAEILKSFIFSAETRPTRQSTFLKDKYKETILSLIDIAFQIVAIASTPLVFNNADVRHAKHAYHKAITEWQNNQGDRETLRNALIDKAFSDKNPKPHDKTEALVWELKCLHHSIEVKQQFKLGSETFLNSLLGKALLAFDRQHQQPKETNIEVDHLTKLSYLAPNLYQLLDAVIRQRGKKADTHHLRVIEKRIIGHFNKLMEEFKNAIKAVTTKRKINLRRYIQGQTLVLLKTAAKPDKTAREIEGIQTTYQNIIRAYDVLIGLNQRETSETVQREKDVTINTLTKHLLFSQQQASGNQAERQSAQITLIP